MREVGFLDLEDANQPSVTLNRWWYDGSPPGFLDLEDADVTGAVR